MIEVQIPDFLWPYRSDHLVRIGRDNDGGYVIDGRDLAPSEALIAFGINDDWSFEEQFHQRRPVPVHGYDAYVSPKIFLARAASSLIRRDGLPAVRNQLRARRELPRFFSGEHTFNQVAIGLDWPPYSLPLKSALQRSVPNLKGKVYLKIDIEGSEYRLLDELVEYADRISGLAIEFHDVDMRLDEIRNFVESFPLVLIHLHCNNNGGVGRNGIPTAIECSFTSAEVDRTQQVSQLPHALDMINGLDHSELAPVRQGSSAGGLDPV